MSESLPVEFTRRAAAHAETADLWWRTNRQQAPNALREELDLALQLIALQPKIGASARNVKLFGVRRVLLRRVSYYLYYRMVSGPPQLVEVLALWHTSRGSNPPV